MNFFENIKHAATLWLARHLPDCKTVTMVFSRALDGEITFRERVTARLHRLMCAACNRYFSQIRFVSRAAKLQEKWLVEGGGREAPEPGDGANERMRKAVSERIDERGFR